MSTINKLEKFRQNLTFKCLLQPEREEVFRHDYALKGRWHEEVFGNDNPITLELGCGKGEYTTALAEQNPDRNFIGVDIKGARLWKGAKYVETQGLKNVRFIRTSIDFIEWIFAPREIAQIWITFADPQVHSPRKRLTGNLFIERYRKFLVPGGVIHLKTDSLLLHEFTASMARENNFEVIAKSTDIYNAPTSEAAAFPPELLTIQTFYEKHYLGLGLPITYIAFKI